MPRPLTEIAAAHGPRPPAGLVLARARRGEEDELTTAGPVEAATVFELGSITKPATGLLLADAVVRGEVELETQLEECLPAAQPREPITLMQLATHTSGLPRIPFALLRRVGFTDTVAPYEASTVEELAGDVAGMRIKRQGKPRYSNVGHALLGQALAARVGRPYEELLEERILRPLGAGELTAHPVTDGLAQPHDKRGRPVPPWRMGAYAPCGCLRGTVGGLLAFTRAHLDPPPQLADAVALALEVHARSAALQVGLGWMREPRRLGWWHNGGTNGSRAYTAFDPERGVAVAAATNSARSADRAGSLALEE